MKISLILLLLLTNVAHAETSVGPWQLPGVDMDLAARMRPALGAGSDTLRSAYRTQSQNTSALAANASRRTVVYTSSKTEANELILPLYCHSSGMGVFFLARIDADKGVWKALAHRAVAQELIEQKTKQGTLASQLVTPILQNLVGELAGSPPPKDAKSTLNLALIAGQEFTDRRIGSTACLTLLVSETLVRAGQWPVIVSSGHEELAFLRDYVQPNQAKLARATRTLNTRWTPPSRAEIKDFVLQRPSASVIWQSRTSIFESVFGRRNKMSDANEVDTAQLVLKKAIASTTPAGIELFRLDAPLPTSWSQTLAREDSGLKKSDPPMVAKVDRAWAYVDRGRAWGLKMDDRLVDEAGKKIAGHVVGYFGPEMGLTSPRGFPISEGAIVFVRAGQTQVKTGDTFGFDPQTFP